jgi:hypothetical protein
MKGKEVAVVRAVVLVVVVVRCVGEGGRGEVGSRFSLTVF